MSGLSWTFFTIMDNRVVTVSGTAAAFLDYCLEHNSRFRTAPEPTLANLKGRNVLYVYVVQYEDCTQYDGRPLPISLVSRPLR